MSGGSIADNKANSASGGIEVMFESVFTMSGGTITRNIGTTSISFAGGVYVAGESTFTLDGGIISDNECGTNGGGVYINSSGKLIMNGGTIHHNKAVSGGGGVMINAAESSSFTMNGGTISDNEANVGGGVCVGAYVPGTDTAYFTMKGGTISGNTATESGGGVGVGSSGIFKKEPVAEGASSGIIYGYDPESTRSNKVRNAGYGIEEGKGHAVYVESGPKTRETTVMPNQQLDSATAGSWGE
jgi:hypothetical protein